MVQPLLDLDVLLYELASCGEYKDEEGDEHVREFDFVADLFEGRVKGICEDVGATMEPIFYLTAKRSIIDIINRSNRFLGEPVLDYVEPLRNGWAVSKEYKGTRKGTTPFHFNALAAYVLATRFVVIAHGLEADDLMCIEQWSRRSHNDTIICSRDKDLRQCPGWQFSWECGAQPSFGPELITRKGWLELKETKHSKVLKGVGLKFFFAQMLTGDAVDNIPGCKGIGPVAAYQLLVSLNTKREHEEAVIEAYKKAYSNDWEERLDEQSKLLWMVRELHEDGSPVHYDWKLK